MVAQQLHFEWDRPSSPEGETRGEGESVCQVAGASERTEPIKSVLMEEVVRRENLKKALRRVCANKGSPGIDGMTVDELKSYLKVHWPEIREQLLQGQYSPQPVKQVLIPKPGGGTRMLGIPSPNLTPYNSIESNPWDRRYCSTDIRSGYRFPHFSISEGTSYE